MSLSAPVVSRPRRPRAPVAHPAGDVRVDRGALAYFDALLERVSEHLADPSRAGLAGAVSLQQYAMRIRGLLISEGWTDHGVVGSPQRRASLWLADALIAYHLWHDHPSSARWLAQVRDLARARRGELDAA